LPQVSDAGVTVTVGTVPLPVTVRFTDVVCVMLPETPFTVTVELPVAAVALAARVKTLVEVVGSVLNVAVTPLGVPDALNVTLPVNPPAGTTEMVLVTLLPCWTETELGDAARLKVGVEAQLLKANDEMFVAQLNTPVTFSY
jgi:hypothetical protein